LVAASKKLAARLPSLPSDDLRDLLATFMRRVVIHENRIEVMISRKELRLLVENGAKMLAGNLSGARKPIDVNDLITLTVEAKRTRCGSQVHLVVPPNSTLAVGHPKPSLIKATARAHGWCEQVIAGKAFDMRSLARYAGLTERYVGKVFACAFLAPDIIESILEGRQPHQRLGQAGLHRSSHNSHCLSGNRNTLDREAAVAADCEDWSLFKAVRCNWTSKVQAV
jgi:site-specific DNA recombinase